MKYLIVDNAQAVRMVLARHILEHEHVAEIKEAESGKEALALISTWRPNVIFTGMGLANGEKGLPFVDAVLRRDPTQTIILCTSMPLAHPDVAEALSLGAFAHMPKPVRADAVHHVLNDFAMERGGLRRVK
ncbi:MAG: response regulator [bacterium]